MIIVDIQQGTPEWHKVRLGKVTGTRIKDAMASDNLPLCDKIIAEIVSDQGESLYVNEVMKWGTDNEPKARKEYEYFTGYTVEQFGFIIHKQHDWLGMSPDGLIKLSPSDNGYFGGIEIKCANTSTHVKYIRQNKVPNEYKYQVYGMFIINPSLQWLDFISYDPRFTIKPLHIVRVKREDIINELELTEIALVKFWNKVMEYYSIVTK